MRGDPCLYCGETVRGNRRFYCSSRCGYMSRNHLTRKVRETEDEILAKELSEFLNRLRESGHIHTDVTVRYG